MINQSRFASLINVLPDATGVDTLYVVVRGTFTLTPSPQLAEAQPAPAASDVYWGEPGGSSLKYASEIHVGKVGTDVALVGSAHAPAGRPVTEMLAALTVAGRRKVIRVVGDRRWRGIIGRSTAPEPFVSMPLVYERAFGGRDDADHDTDHDADHDADVGPGAAGAGGLGRGLAEERNPVGTGFRGRRAPARGSALRLPNLEDPRRPWRAIGDRPPPVGFAFVAPSWQPRRAYAGTYDDVWRTTRAPFLPADFDARFCNAASADLTFDAGLVGGEPLVLDGVSRRGQQRSSIPAARPHVEVVVARRREQPPVHLETVLVEPDEGDDEGQEGVGRLSLTWRAVLRCDRRALKIESIHIREESGPCPAPSS